MDSEIDYRLDERCLFAEGESFGAAGPYERLSGRVIFRVDPAAEAQRVVTDIGLAPVDAEGRVRNVSPGSAAVYGLGREELCASTVQQLVERGVLSPSVTQEVMRTRQPAQCNYARGARSALTCCGALGRRETVGTW